jgi:hypothetical protein
MNLVEKLALFSEYWSPRTVAHFNEYDIMVVRHMSLFIRFARDILCVWSR